jgi:methionine-gamma-lyase
MTLDLNIDTRCAIGELDHDRSKKSHAVPIFQTSSFLFEDTEDGRAKFAKEVPGYVYSRLGNPTVEALEKSLALVEEGCSCVAFSSGMAAVTAVFLGLLKSGDHAVIGEIMYGPSLTIAVNRFSQLGIISTPVDTSNVEDVKNAIRPNTKMIFFEVCC